MTLLHHIPYQAMVSEITFEAFFLNRHDLSTDLNNFTDYLSLCLNHGVYCILLRKKNELSCV